MKILLFSFALLGALFANPLLAEETAAARAERDARAKAATEQRLAYAASAEYNPYDTRSRDSQKSAWEALNKGEFAGAITEAKKGLAFAKYDIDLLIILATAYREAGDISNADKTRAQWMGLVDSILASGDGRDFETAFHVIAVSEEYAVLRVLGLKVTSQALIGHGDSQFDEMRVTEPKSGHELTLYFNIDLPLKWLNQQFTEKKK